MLSGIAIFIAEKNDGNAAGNFSLKNIAVPLIPIVLSSSSFSLFADLSPSCTDMVIGKNVISTATSTLLHMPYPSHSTKSGAIAVTGIVCVVTITGYNALSTHSKRSITTASPTPRTTEIRSPISVTSIVAGVCTVNNGSRSSHIFTAICVGDGNMYAAFMHIAMTCHNISRPIPVSTAGRCFFIYYLPSLPFP